MAFKSKDGKDFSMASRRNAHDAASGVKGQRASALGTNSPEQVLSPPQSQDGSSGMDQADQGQDAQQAPEQVAAEHGPATQVLTTHDPEMGVHTVTSTHPDGHEETSTHASADEAHEHAKKLVGGKKKEMGMTPEGDDDDY